MILVCLTADGLTRYSYLPFSRSKQVTQSYFTRTEVHNFLKALLSDASLFGFDKTDSGARQVLGCLDRCFYRLPVSYVLRELCLAFRVTPADPIYFDFAGCNAYYHSDLCLLK